ncbi:MAG: GntR family transcriptional regulator, transcriptional repressor for pyruvate dehydrogenase complex [Thermomicrobiales bacterium]|jgi:DNA-binding FadR family transcriptional regulator|nr:GntR family transcriptional regulator, transcriptional repressor for pyruvate dehydrogenase complex [Thermomicrobiales bacterium]
MDFRSVLVTRSYEQVVQQIRERIRSGALVPGQRLPTERELADSFAVSRGVVREALKVLASMGFVESRQGSGTYVCSNPIPSISRALTLSATTEEHSILSLYELREALDVVAARLAAERRTPDQAEAIGQHARASAQAAAADDVAAFSRADGLFHRHVCEAAASPYLTLVLDSVREIQSSVVALIMRLPGSMDIAGDHHLGIAEAIAREDGDRATELMAMHVRYSADAVRGILDQPASERGELRLNEW